MSEFEREPWIADARALLEQSTQALDAATLSRLNRARQAALTQRPRRAARGWFAAAGLAGSAALLAALVLWLPQRAGTPSAPAAGTAAIEAEDEIDFYQDLEFYAWLGAQEPDGDG
jgi:hypothetical protein